MGSGSGLETLAEAEIGGQIGLPRPKLKGGLSVEEAIARRRSVRDFSPDSLSLEQIAQLLWAAAGLTSKHGQRAAPSAGARYPLEVYLACEQGLFHYDVPSHSLIKVKAGEVRPALAAAAYGQTFVAEAAISVVFTAIYERTTSRYGERGIRYVHMDVGHAAENVHLQAEALGLGSVPVGAFDDEAVAQVLGLSEEQRPVYLVPVGRRG
jgi:SagB-type dehydrogenase family enzyme